MIIPSWKQRFHQFEEGSDLKDWTETVRFTFSALKKGLTNLLTENNMSPEKYESSRTWGDI